MRLSPFQVGAMIGRTIDRYRIIEKIGEGGMGVVYKARDTLLRRHVALKFLPPDRLKDSERRDRFIQEAKSASALNHPGIVAIHDVLNVDDQDVIVMELVEGEPLDQILLGRRLRLGAALRYAIGIAGAVARAHTAGIVHRDLKPSNVMVTRDDEVKILDFGLAKRIDVALPDEDTPTMTVEGPPLTAKREIMGTIPYMSPEQASGKPIDARSDIFSFGVIAYEMLTGRHPFRQASRTEMLQAIVDPHPAPPSRILPTLPPEIDRAILRCLRKDPRQRWQSLSDLKAVLEGIREDSESGRTILVDRARPARTKRWAFGAAVTIVLASLVVAYLQFRNDPLQKPPLALSRLTYDGGLSAMPTISADGKLVAYSSDRGGDGQWDIWVRHINQPGPARLTRHPANDWMPNFSPDGSRVVYHSWRDGGGIYLVNTLGGESKRLASDGLFPRFSPDGTRIVFMEELDWSPVLLRRMFLVSPDGGKPRPFVPEFGTFAPPASIGAIWSPDGQRLLFHGAPFEDPESADWWVAPVEGGQPTSTGVKEAIPRIDVIQYPCVWLPDRLLFVAGTSIEGLNLYSVGISSVGRIAGPHRALTTGPGMTWIPTVAGDGRMALSRLEWLVHLWQVELEPGGRARGGPRKIATSATPKLSFSLTRDGSHLAYSIYSGPIGRRLAEVHVRDLTTDQETVPVSLLKRTPDLHPRIAPDGSVLGWTGFFEGRQVVFITPTAEPANPQELCGGCTLFGFTSDASHAMVGRDSTRLELMSLSDGHSREMIRLEEGALLGADLSPNDRWVALWTGWPDGRVTIHVAPFGDKPVPPENWIEVAGGEFWVSEPRWSHDNRILYYFSDRDDFVCIWAQPLDGVTKRPVGEPFPVVHGHQSGMNMQLPRPLFMMTVAHGRLVFNAADMSSEVYAAMLDDFGE